METTRFPPPARIFDLILSSQRRQRRLFKRPWFICSSSTFSRFFSFAFLSVHYWIRSHVVPPTYHRCGCETLQLWILPQLRWFWRTTSIHWTNNRFPFSAQQLCSFGRSWVAATQHSQKEKKKKKKKFKRQKLFAFKHSNGTEFTVAMSFSIAFSLWVRPTIRIIIYLRPGKHSEKQSNPMSRHLLLSVFAYRFISWFSATACSAMSVKWKDKIRHCVKQKLYHVRFTLTLMMISRSYPFIWTKKKLVWRVCGISVSGTKNYSFMSWRSDNVSVYT